MNQYIAAHYKVRAKPAFILSSPDCDWERRSSRPLTTFRRRRRCCTSFRRVFLVFFISSPFFITSTSSSLTHSKPCCVDLNADRFTAADTLMGWIYGPICLLGTFPLALLAMSWTRVLNHHRCNCHFVLYHVCGTLTHCWLKGEFCPIKPDCVL